MSRFIKSYTNITSNTESFLKMKLYSHLFTEAWAFHIIPSVHLYFETNSPLSHGKIWKKGLNGLYLSLQWGKWLYTVGITKKI